VEDRIKIVTSTDCGLQWPLASTKLYQKRDTGSCD